jgi:hypothetical protein
VISKWIQPLSIAGACNGKNYGLSVSPDVQAWLDQIVNRTNVLFRDQKSTLQYSIFQEGRSVLRDITNWNERLPSLVQSNKLLVAISMLLWMYSDRSSSVDERHLDAAHEVLLGVTADNLAQAEYAATHRGKTSWSEQHPLTDEDDMLHAIVHRLEGNAIGEGGYSGWANAKYWSAGGPKQKEILGDHPVHQALSLICKQQLPSSSFSRLVDDSQSRQYEIIAGNDLTRWVTVKRGYWDPIAWIDLCQSQAERRTPTGLTEADILELQVAELCLLVRWQLIQISGSFENF